MEQWKTNILQNLCTIGDGNHSSKYPKKSEMIESGVPFIRGNNLKDGELCSKDILYISPEKHKELKKGHLRTGDVLFTNRGEIGKVAIVTEYFNGANLNSQIAWLRCGNQLLPKYLLYSLQTKAMTDLYDSEKSGAALQQFTIRMLKIVEVHYPPIPEQQRIVAILDQAFADIEKARANAEKNLKNARELFDSYLNQVFSQGGEGWVESELFDHVKFIDYRGKTPKKTQEGLRLITAKNVRMGYLKKMPEEFVARDSYDEWMTRGIPEKGDILFTTEAPLANVAQLDTSERVVFAQRIITMQPDRSVFDDTFLKYLLMSKPVQERILKKGTGATVTGIKASLLKKIIIEYPFQLTEQRMIANTLDFLDEKVNKLEVVFSEKLNSLDELKKSLLQKAFSGELTKTEGHAA